MNRFFSICQISYKLNIFLKEKSILSLRREISGWLMNIFILSYIQVIKYFICYCVNCQ